MKTKIRGKHVQYALLDAEGDYFAMNSDQKFLEQLKAETPQPLTLVRIVTKYDVIDPAWPWPRPKEES
jgi:hypothetical protein